ncbi:hypothetical protein KUTeg_015614 [Tegillarca granosa]|uniref:C-type lectin domain-containing protein n=1 Tax=Tegillarca granosa TaxID=220873 RepID=A0ABQ9EVV2_TEGGR|nr:hypothetical protein KUTeg_015614 [Tegillarca granosa]
MFLRGVIKSAINNSLTSLSHFCKSGYQKQGNHEVIFIVGCLDIALARQHCLTYWVYPYDRQVQNWRQARRVCKSKGGDLVKIDDQNEDAMLTGLLESEITRGQDGWYIGGRYNNGEWRWADGSPMDYSNFPYLRAEGGRITLFAGIFRDERIGKNTYSWGYLTRRSNNKMGFICEKNYC